MEVEKLEGFSSFGSCTARALRPGTELACSSLLCHTVDNHWISRESMAGPSRGSSQTSCFSMMMAFPRSWILWTSSSLKYTLMWRLEITVTVFRRGLFSSGTLKCNMKVPLHLSVKAMEKSFFWDFLGTLKLWKTARRILGTFRS